jgi:hypothetical protein
VRQFGIAGCAARMAQEFGDHPEAAASRMRWIRQLIGGMHTPANCVVHVMLTRDPADLRSSRSGHTLRYWGSNRINH